MGLGLIYEKFYDDCKMIIGHHNSQLYDKVMAKDMMNL